MTGCIISQGGAMTSLTKASIRPLTDGQGTETGRSSRSHTWPSRPVPERRVIRRHTTKTHLTTHKGRGEIQKDEVIRLYHGKHDSVASERKPGLGDFHQSISGPDVWLRALTLGSREKPQEDKKGLVRARPGQTASARPLDGCSNTASSSDFSPLSEQAAESLENG